MKITWVSNYSCPIWKSSNRTAVIGHPRDRAPITRQLGARRTNHDREFCYRYDYRPNWTPLSPITIILACCQFHWLSWSSDQSSLKKGRKHKQHETSKYGIRWSLRGTHWTAALALFFWKVFLLKWAQVLSNKWNATGTSETAVSALKRCLSYQSGDIPLSSHFLLIDANSDTLCVPVNHHLSID